MMKSETADCRIKPALPLCSSVPGPHVLHKSARHGAAINQAWQCTPNKLGCAVTCASGGVGVAYAMAFATGPVSIHAHSAQFAVVSCFVPCHCYRCVALWEHAHQLGLLQS